MGNFVRIDNNIYNTEYIRIIKKDVEHLQIRVILGAKYDDPIQVNHNYNNLEDLNKDFELAGDQICSYSMYASFRNPDTFNGDITLCSNVAPDVEF